jgi:hypothetical protein
LGTETFTEIKLNPGVDETGKIANFKQIDEYFVLFGRYRHRLERDKGTFFRVDTHESEPTEILWRVMSLDSDSNPTKAILLSHYVLECMSYQSSERRDKKPQRTWAGSEVQTWLNSAKMVQVKLRDIEKEGYKGFFVKVKGFLHEDYFTEKEKSMLLPYEGDNGEKMTLPSGEADISPGLFKPHNWVYSGELATWFGGYEYSHMRKAYFKRGVISIPYWTRSSFTGEDLLWSWSVHYKGWLLFHSVADVGTGIRPVCVLDLSSVLFKAPLSFVDAYSTPDLAGTEKNPYVLYTSGDIQLTSARINEGILSLDFDTEIAPAGKWPDTADFVLRSAAEQVKVVQVTSDDSFSKRLILRLEKPVNTGEELYLTYTVSADSTGSLYTTSGAICKRGTNDAVANILNYKVQNSIERDVKDHVR